MKITASHPSNLRHASGVAIRRNSAVECDLVSATSMSGEVEVRGMVRPRVPNYAVRRLVVGAGVGAVALLGLVGLVEVVPGFGGTPASASGLDPAIEPVQAVVHVARAGDTLWSIADEYRGEVQREDFIDALIGLNGGGSRQAARIEVGQAVLLP